MFIINAKHRFANCVAFTRSSEMHSHGHCKGDIGKHTSRSTVHWKSFELYSIIKGKKTVQIEVVSAERPRHTASTQRPECCGLPLNSSVNAGKKLLEAQLQIGRPAPSLLSAI